MPGFDYSQSDALHPGYEFDYVENATDVAVSGTSTLIDGNAVVFNGSTKVKIEFSCAIVDASGGNNTRANLFDGASDLGTICFVQGGSGAYVAVPVYGARFLTPSAGSHTYHVKATKGGGSVDYYGTNSGQCVPMWYRITKA
jgi:hypothetical protein